MKQTDPRRLAYDVLCRVEEGGYADLALDGALNAAALADPRDRGLATELVYGVLRRQGRLDFALAHFSRQPLAKLESRVLWLLRLGAHQLLHLERVPARAAVHTTVELARTLGLERATGFINGLLRSLERGRNVIPWPDAEFDPRGHLVHALSLPPWLAGRWLNEFAVDEALALATAMQEGAPFTLRANTLRCTREELLEALNSAGHSAAATTYAPEGITVLHRGNAPLPGSNEGWFQVQDEASMLIPHLLGAQTGELIYDGCAAPGGKTTQIAALTGNGARIIASDLHPKRLQLVRQGAARLGCTAIECRPFDLFRIPDFLDDGACDRILLDAPCTGLGVLRRNPESRWRRSEADILELARIQRQLLANVAPKVRPGGILLYSVCTITPEETDHVIDNFLADHPDFRRDDPHPDLPAAWAELFDSAGALRTFPHRHGGMDAFYAVRLRRQG